MIERGGYRWELVCAFEVPGKPQAKQRPRTVKRHGKTRTYTPRETFDHEWKISRCARRLGKGSKPGGYWTDLHEELYMVARCIFQRPRSRYGRKYADGLILRPYRPDKDNLDKACADGIQKAGNLIHDDAQFVSGECWKYDTERDGKPRTEIEIYRIMAESKTAE